MTHLPRRLLVGLALASLTMTVGFWLKWRVSSPFDSRVWYTQATSQFAYTDIIGVYSKRHLADHPLPYAELKLEYPPVVGMVMYLTSFAPGPRGYLVANYAVLALAGLGTVWALFLLTDRARLWVFAATPPLALYAGLNWDLLAVLFAVASLVFFQRGRDGWGAAALALGVWSKLFPILLLPAIVLLRVRGRNWRGLAVLGAGFSLVSLAVNLPFLLLSYSGWRYSFDFHALRRPDGGSLWSKFGEIPVAVINDVSVVAIVVGLVAIGVAAMRRDKHVLEQGLAALALFVLVDKASSPQYHLWLMPFLALLPAPLWLIGLFVAMDLAYYASSFQILYLTWGGQSPIAGLISATAEPISLSRHLVLLFLFLWAAFRKLT